MDVECKVYRKIKSVEEGFKIGLQQIDEFKSTVERFVEDCISYSVQSSDAEYVLDEYLSFGIFRKDMPIVYGTTEQNKMVWKST